MFAFLPADVFSPFLGFFFFFGAFNKMERARQLLTPEELNLITLEHFFDSELGLDVLKM